MDIEKKSVPLKKTLTFLIVFICVSFIFAQQPSQKEQLRILIWSELDAFPGSFEDNKETVQQPEQTTLIEKQIQDDLDPLVAKKLKLFGFAINRAKQITPFLLSGMISGWNFEYVPYDKTRNVAEIFEFSEVVPFNQSINPISYVKPEPLDNKLVCWAYCNRTETQQLSYRRWSSIVHPKVHGKGTSSVENEFEGIKEACENAVKNAVREYWRIYEKNKPKEILGKVLLIGNPRIYISEGQYVADLEFFLETDKIVKYTYYWLF